MNTAFFAENAQITEHLYRKAAKSRIPIGGAFELSPVCNLACKMCYVRKTAQEINQSLRPIVSLKQWLQIARQAKDAGMLYLLLTGGEPFLWPDFWTLYEELVKMGLLVSINTNGTLIDEDTVSRLKQNPPRRINVTLYGSCDETYRQLCGADGMFSRVDSAITRLQKAGLNVKLNGSFTPDNAQDMEQIIAYASDRGIPLDTTTYMFPPLRRRPDQVGDNARFSPEAAAWYRIQCCKHMRTPEQYQIYLKKICAGVTLPPELEEGCVDPIEGKIRCRAGKASFWVTWDGWLTACGMVPEPKVEINNRPFAEAWHALTMTADALRVSGQCTNCQNQFVCHACAAMAFCETGSFEGVPTYLCRMSQEMRKIAERELRSLQN